MNLGHFILTIVTTCALVLCGYVLGLKHATEHKPPQTNPEPLEVTKVYYGPCCCHLDTGEVAWVFNKNNTPWKKKRK